MMHAARGSKTATETARASGSAVGYEPPTVRGRAIRIALAIAATGALVAFAALAAFAAPGAPHPAAGVAGQRATNGLRSTTPLIVTKVRKPRRHVGKASISLFTATPSMVPAAGGTVHLLAVVTGATKCRFSSTASVSRLPAKVSCAAGRGSTTIKLPANATSSALIYSFALSASGPAGGAKDATVTVVERPSRVSNGPPPITAQPASRSAVAGTTVTFTVGTASASQTSVQWQLSRDAGRSWSDIAGATAPAYSFTATTAQNGYKFRAVVTYRGTSATTGVATLTVSPAAATAAVTPLSTTPTASTPNPAPAITLQPQGQAVQFYSVATFTAAASGTPAPTVQWQVSTDGGGTWLPAPGAANATSYSFTPAATDSGSEYRAVFTNAAGSVATQPAGLFVSYSPIQAPSITLQPSDAIGVPSGSGVSFTAVASGNPTPTVQWQVSRGGGPWVDIPGATSLSYSYFPVAVGDSGSEYRAVFSTVATSIATNPAQLTVTAVDSPVVITAQPSNRAVSAGSNVTFYADASGTPEPNVQWQVSTNGGGSWGNVSGGNSPNLTFQAAATETGYEYQAVFTNVINNVIDSATSSPATLIVGADEGSTNWSGYLATAATSAFSAVSGSWTVPVATCPSAITTYSSQWIGIDGGVAGNSTVEQDGTDSDCSFGTPTYYAWYEMYGDAAVNGGFSTELPTTTNPVFAGDSMNASISVSGTSWTLAISDATRGWSASFPVQFSAARSTAEWVVEAPEINGGALQLTDFGSAAFSSATAVANGQSKTIAQLSGAALEMESGTQSGALLALPGPLNGSGDGFTDTWYAYS
jgi:hypothetical protein